VIVRHACLDDAAEMARVVVDTFLSAHRGQMPEAAWLRRRDEWTYEVSERGWRRTLQVVGDGARPLQCVYVAEAKAGQVVGVAMGRQMEWDEALGEVPALYVRETHQGQGAGRALLRAVALHLRTGGVSALDVAVLASNTPARRFYEALGGHVTGERTFDEGGFMLPEVVYRWADLDQLDR
jgi:ribosomal protein S18 acetylase RimI-like enzyme